MTEATTWNRAPVTLDELPMFAPAPLFGGTTYDAALDEARLSGQLKAVFDLMSDGQWRTLYRIADQVWSKTGTRPSEAGVSARLRDLRKVKFGGHKVERRRRSAGLWEYRVEVKHV